MKIIVVLHFVAVYSPSELVPFCSIVTVLLPRSSRLGKDQGTEELAPLEITEVDTKSLDLR